jgi:hypothetical protein
VTLLDSLGLELDISTVPAAGSDRPAGRVELDLDRHLERYEE